MRAWAIAVFTALASCTRSSDAPPPAASSRPASAAKAAPSARIVAEPAASDAAVEPPTLDPDGNDDDEDPGQGSLPTAARWEKVGTPPLALTRICDLTPLGDALYAAHANVPLGTDGATITRYRPSDEKRSFRVAFDWNRAGEPAKGGGAGQGFLRAHALGGRLFVPDADPPYAGLGLLDWGAEGYVFVSDRDGTFAPSRAPHHRPPSTPEIGPDGNGRAGAAVLPRAYHVIDVVRFRGGLYASTGSVPPTERAWKGASPGALHRASEGGGKWLYEVDYPYPWKDGVWRLTFLVRFQDRLYAGIQDYDGRDPNDFVVFEPPRDATTIRREDAHPTRITRAGASGTLRWWADTRAQPHRLYWLAWTRDGIVLRVTLDGKTWAALDLRDAGIPTDVTRFRDAVVVLTDRGLYRLSGRAIDGSADILAMRGVADARATAVALLDAPDGPKPTTKGKKASPFEVSDYFCTAPLAVMNNVLYAGGQRGGALYKLVE